MSVVGITHICFITELVKKYKGLEKIREKNISRSQLQNHMDLCSRNRVEIIENFENVIDKESAGKVCTAMKRVQYCNENKDH